MKPDGKKNSTPKKPRKKLLSADMPLRGPEAFDSLVEWVASPDYAVMTERVLKNAAERKKASRKEYDRRYHARKKAKGLTRIKDICRVAFSVPTVPLLPAPGQVVRWPAETIYSPIKRTAETPYRYRPDHKRPQWQIDAERVIVASPRSFGYIVQALGMTLDDCAAYLRVTVATIRAWENGDEAIPFAAYWLLHVTYKAQIFKAKFPQWEGWELQDAGPDVGKLVDANRSYAFTPQEIACIPMAWHTAYFQANRAERLQAELDEARAENTRLRQEFNTMGVTKELRKMQGKLTTMLDAIGTAEVIDHRPTTRGRTMEKVA